LWAPEQSWHTVKWIATCHLEAVLGLHVQESRGDACQLVFSITNFLKNNIASIKF
jgi:hypothetical protein